MYTAKKARAKIIKKLWKALPPSVRSFAMRTLCACTLSKKTTPPKALPLDAPVYIIGCFQAGGGLSRSAHLYAKNLRQSHDRVICVDSTDIVLQQQRQSSLDPSFLRFADIVNNTDAATVVIHHNPPQFQWILFSLGRKFLQNKTIVAYWAWELEDIPALWKNAICYADTIEVPSSFTQKAFAKHTTKPVVVKPHILMPPSGTKTNFCKNGTLACLFIMDMGSLCTRKNPEAVICAFTKAFTPNEAYLTLKLSQTSNFAEDFAKIKRLAQNFPHIHILTKWLNDAELDRLYLDHDVYISLHRSEGYGLTIHEAMQRNLHVVATGWSGNMDFMTGENVFAVPYTLVPIHKSTPHFDNIPKAHWAEADTDTAAELLQNIRKKLLFASKAQN